jgi:uncharacterized protein (TIGR02284 family)
MKTLASCTVQPRLSCMLHSAFCDELLQVADLPPVALRGLLAWALRPDKKRAASRPGPQAQPQFHAGGPMNQSMNQLNELIELTRDGQRFYQHAADEAKDVQLQHLFRDLAQAKTQIIQALSVKVAAHHEQPSQGGTLTGRMRELYADARSRIGDHDTAYVDQLEQTEAHILRAFEDAVGAAEPDVRALLAIELPKLRACHERMRQLKDARH